MIEIIGPTVSPFVGKILAAAGYKRLAYTHTEQGSIRELKKYNPATRKGPIVLFDGAAGYDSTVILRRFDHEPPSPALLSDDANIAARQQMLEDWSDESL